MTRPGGDDHVGEARPAGAVRPAPPASFTPLPSRSRPPTGMPSSSGLQPNGPDAVPARLHGLPRRPVHRRLVVAVGGRAAGRRAAGEPERRHGGARAADSRSAGSCWRPRRGWSPSSTPSRRCATTCGLPVGASSTSRRRPSCTTRCRAPTRTRCSSAGAILARVEPNLVVDLAAPPALQDRRRPLRPPRRPRRCRGRPERRPADVLDTGAGAGPPRPATACSPCTRWTRSSCCCCPVPGRDRLCARRVATARDGGRHGAVPVRARAARQYIAALDAARDVGGLDLLFTSLLAEAGPPLRFLSFGIASEQGGEVLNEGLTAWKEGFGARALPHLVYELA